jgi:hypothetical protein
LCCISFGLRLLNTPLVSCGHCVVYPSVYGFWIPLWYLVAIVLYILRFTASEYLFGILWPLCCISFGLRLLNTPLVSCGHCVAYPSVYVFWLPLWYLVAIVLYILWFNIFWIPLWYLQKFLRVNVGEKSIIRTEWKYENALKPHLPKICLETTSKSKLNFKTGKTCDELMKGEFRKFYPNW